MELRVGNKYRLGRKIGSGSFGDIYLGECPPLQLSGFGGPPPRQLWGRGGGKRLGFEAVKSEVACGAVCFSHLSLGPPQVGLELQVGVRPAGAPHRGGRGAPAAAGWAERVLPALLPAVRALGLSRAWESPAWVSAPRALSPGSGMRGTERPGLLLAPARPLPGVRPPGIRRRQAWE